MTNRGRAYVLEVRVRSAARSARPFPIEAFDDTEIEWLRQIVYTPLEFTVDVPATDESLEAMRRIAGQPKRVRIANDLHRRGWHAIARFIERGPR